MWCVCVCVCALRKETLHSTTSVRGKVIAWFLCCYTRTQTPASGTTYVWRGRSVGDRLWDLGCHRFECCLCLLLQDGETPLDIATRLKFNKIIYMLKTQWWTLDQSHGCGLGFNSKQVKKSISWTETKSHVKTIQVIRKMSCGPAHNLSSIIN